MPDTPNPITLAVAAGVFVVCAAVAFGIILLAAKQPALFANLAENVIARLFDRTDSRDSPRAIVPGRHDSPETVPRAVRASKPG
jgi:hypothetical protein